MSRISIIQALLTATLTVASGAAAAASADAAPARQDFMIGADSLTMPVPDGYCVPTGQLIGVAQVTAAADKVNVTLATFIACKGNGVEPFQDYVLLKVPTDALLVQVDKVSALAQLEAVMLAPDAPKFDEKMQEETAKSIGDVVGRKASMKGNYGYMGRDADCIYMGGKLSMSIGDAGGEGSVVTCVTVAAGKVLAVNAYDMMPNASFTVLKARTRSIAVSIGAAPATTK